MNAFGFLLFYFQACLVQTVFGQCLGRFEAVAPIATPCGNKGTGLAAFGYTGYADVAYPAVDWPGRYGCCEAYGGVGEGNVAVAGELPVAGTTAVTGQVPIMGVVKFAGPVCAKGTVSIAGKCTCACGCGY